MDGVNATGSPSGPMLDTTFGVLQEQSYPDQYPGGPHAPFTGAEEVNPFSNFHTYGNAVYHIEHTFAYGSGTFQFSWTASGLQDIADESWGIDNVVVSTNVGPPAPSCFGVDGATLTPVTTPDGTAYVSAGVSTAAAPGATASENSFTGTEGADVIIGTSDKDYVVGLGDNDKICTLGGNDRPTGRKGNDQVDAGADNDSIWGQPGDDTLLGGTGNDSITGQEGNDSVDGGDGTDICNGGAGADTGAGCEASSNIP
jgi:Ca2+-binding RTX toxin-like protein